MKKLLIKIYLYLSDCDGMCNHCSGTLKKYCEINKNDYNGKAKD
jgi:hypothetical protein